MYIGLSENIDKRYREHANGKDIKHSRIDRAIRKHGEDKFDLEIIEELPNDRTLLMEREAYWVSHYDTYEDKNHFNLTPGGDFNPMKLPEVRAKISGENNPMKNPDVVAKMSGENHPMYSKKHTQESKEKMSKAVSKALNTSGYYRVYKMNRKNYKQGFTWVYKYPKDGNRKEISSVDIKKLEEKVRAKGLKWLKFD